MLLPRTTAALARVTAVNVKLGLDHRGCRCTRRLGSQTLLATSDAIGGPLLARLRFRCRQFPRCQRPLTRSHDDLRRSRQLFAMVQVLPLSVKDAGLPVLPVWVAWKPMLMDAFAAIVELWLTLRAVTCPDDGV